MGLKGPSNQNSQPKPAEPPAKQATPMPTAVSAAISMNIALPVGAAEPIGLDVDLLGADASGERSPAYSKGVSKDPEENIVYEKGPFYAFKVKTGIEIRKNRATGATLVGTVPDQASAVRFIDRAARHPNNF